jgi:hypothetical protein
MALYAQMHHNELVHPARSVARRCEEKPVQFFPICDTVAWRGEQLDLHLVDEAVDVRHVSGVGQAKLYPHLAGEGGGRRWLC